MHRHPTPRTPPPATLSLVCPPLSPPNYLPLFRAPSLTTPFLAGEGRRRRRRGRRRREMIAPTEIFHSAVCVPAALTVACLCDSQCECLCVSVSLCLCVTVSLCLCVSVSLCPCDSLRLSLSLSLSLSPPRPPLSLLYDLSNPRLTVAAVRGRRRRKRRPGRASSHPARSAQPFCPFHPFYPVDPSQRPGPTRPGPTETYHAERRRARRRRILYVGRRGHCAGLSRGSRHGCSGPRAGIGLSRLGEIPADNLPYGAKATGVCFRGGKAPTRRNLGAASLTSFVIVAKGRGPDPVCAVGEPAPQARSRRRATAPTARGSLSRFSRQ
jgi:hypothetical protein